MTETKNNNWPPCYPVIYHNIQADILDGDSRRMTEQSYKLWLSVVVTSATRNDGVSIIGQILIAILYLLAWPLFDFFFRHRCLYQAFKFNSLNYFRWFFLNTFLDIVFGLFIGIGWFYGGGGGLIAMTDNFKNDRIVAGVFCAICVALILTQVTLHIILFRKVYVHFKTHDDWTLLPGQKNKSRKEQARV
ncbi:4784_t:CDS:2 [Funneliformis geosporum]|uniref:6422_t:CDS:1 n=1 Tax=Funneliformis geosporum TaxID=1117311 RepID=A0A9W4WVC5_9GLOM|nr:6422_t:CDS:2 [Funneliformis geosporum]CAI2188634.1 4784_t:CDS:2 [Funneliformis geosporum]